MVKITVSIAFRASIQKCRLSWSFATFANMALFECNRSIKHRLAFFSHSSVYLYGVLFHFFRTFPSLCIRFFVFVKHRQHLLDWFVCVRVFVDCPTNHSDRSIAFDITKLDRTRRWFRSLSIRSLTTIFRHFKSAQFGCIVCLRLRFSAQQLKDSGCSP